MAARAVVLCLALHPTLQATATTAGASSSTTSNRRRLRQRPQSQPQQQEQQTTSSLPKRHRDLQSRIVNGRDARGSEDFPFFVQWYRGCGATLIHSDVLLTAAHCYSDTYKDHKVRVEGQRNRLTRVVDSRVHPDFNDETNWVNNNENDFMLLKLAAPLPGVRPVPIHHGDATELTDGEDLTIVGYGLTSEDGAVASILQEATVQYHEDCSFASYRPEKVGQDTMFCAHGVHNETHSVDSCQGDSGGPILRKMPQGWMQVGVTSWGEGCARPEAPGIYARTAVAFDWIQSQLCELSDAPPPHCYDADDSRLPELPDDWGLVLHDKGEEDAQDSGLLPESSSPQLDTVQSLEQQQRLNETILSAVYSLRVDVHYDDFPQEISWALAKKGEFLRNRDEFELVHVSRRPSVAFRNQMVSQQIKNVRGNYKLEFYDTIAGDGLAVQDLYQDAIEVWLLETTVETTMAWDEDSQSSRPVQTKELDTQFKLLWSHKGDFGEFVHTTMAIEEEG